MAIHGFRIHRQQEEGISYEVAGIVSYMKQKAIRIFMVTAEDYPTHRADLSCLFGKYLPARGIHSDIVTVSEQNADQLPPWGGGESRVKTIRGGAVKRNILKFLFQLSQLCQCKADRYDVIQIRDLPMVATFALLVGWLRGLPVIYWMSYPTPDGQVDLARQRGLSSGLMKFLYPLVVGVIGRFLLYRVVLRWVKHSFVQSDVMKTDLVRKGIAEQKLTPVPMGVDMAKVQAFTPQEQQLRGEPEDYVLVYMGILERVRQIPVLLDTLKLVQQTIPNTKLVLAGDTPDTDYRDWLLQLVADKGLKDSVIWTGWLQPEEAWSFVAAADLALSPFPRGYLLDSASPTKVAEYLALGVPTLANDQPDQNYVLNASGGGVAVPYQADLWAQQTIVLLQNKEKRTVMAAAGKAWIAEHRSYAGIADLVAAKYKYVMGNS